MVNTITNRKTTPSGKLKGKTPEERKQQWFNHFKKLLGTSDSSPSFGEIETIHHDVNIPDDQFTLEELKEAKKQIREGKAPGEDGIMPELLKRVDLNSILLDISNRFYLDNEMPEQLGILNLIPLPKSGDLSKTGNYRGIALTSLVMKLINRMILNRLRPIIDPLLRGNQSGFRPGRSTVSQVLALRRILEEVKKNNLEAVMVFIDFSKAFDSINHEAMFSILKAYGVPPRMLEAIRLCYGNLRARVVSPDGDTDLFPITAGVMQGDTLAPFLFVTVLDYCLTKAIGDKTAELGLTLHQRKSSRYPAKAITDLDFADDIVLMSDTVEQASILLQRVERECEAVGLRLNSPKTKAMFLNTDVAPLENILGEIISQALTDTGEQDFKYLGSWCDNARDISVRKALAWQALNKMHKVWKSDMDTWIKVRLFRATVESILMYGSQTWSLTKSEEKSLHGTYTRMLRIVQNIPAGTKISNKVLYGKLKPITESIRERRLKLAGHVYRDTSSPAHMAITWQPTHGRTNRGRPAATILDSLLRDTQLGSVAELESCMQDRGVWRNLCESRADRLDPK